MERTRNVNKSSEAGQWPSTPNKPPSPINTGDVDQHCTGCLTVAGEYFLISVSFFTHFIESVDHLCHEGRSVTDCLVEVEPRSVCVDLWAEPHRDNRGNSHWLQIALTVIHILNHTCIWCVQDPHVLHADMQLSVLKTCDYKWPLILQYAISTGCCDVLEIPSTTALRVNNYALKE